MAQIIYSKSDRQFDLLFPQPFRFGCLCELLYLIITLLLWLSAEPLFVLVLAGSQHHIPASLHGPALSPAQGPWFCSISHPAGTLNHFTRADTMAYYEYSSEEDSRPPPPPPGIYEYNSEEDRRPPPPPPGIYEYSDDEKDIYVRRRPRPRPPPPPGNYPTTSGRQPVRIPFPFLSLQHDWG